MYGSYQQQSYYPQLYPQSPTPQNGAPQKILDAITSNRMDEMQNQINALRLRDAMAGVVRYPTTSAYCAGNNPYCGCPAGI